MPEEVKKSSKQELDENCPKCGEKLVFFTTANGKSMKKCSTGGWDAVKREATGCTYVEWMKPGVSKASDSEGIPFPIEP